MAARPRPPTLRLGVGQGIEWRYPYPPDERNDPKHRYDDAVHGDLRSRIARELKRSYARRLPRAKRANTRSCPPVGARASRGSSGRGRSPLRTGTHRVSASEFEAGLSLEPEDQLVQAEFDEARKKRRTGRARIVGSPPPSLSSPAFSSSRCLGSRTTATSGTSSSRCHGSGSSRSCSPCSSTSRPTGRRSSPRCRAFRTSGHARHPRLDRALERRAWRRGGRDGDIVRDATRVGLQGRPAGLAVVVTASGTSS